MATAPGSDSTHIHRIPWPSCQTRANGWLFARSAQYAGHLDAKKLKRITISVRRAGDQSDDKQQRVIRRRLHANVMWHNNVFMNDRLGRRLNHCSSKGQLVVPSAIKLRNLPLHLSGSKPIFLEGS